MPVLQQPEAYISRAAELLDEKGSIRSDDTRMLLVKFMASFARWAKVTGRISEHEDFDDSRSAEK
jgi:hypothetical protein